MRLDASLCMEAKMFRLFGEIMNAFAFQLLDDDGPLETGNSKAFDDPAEARAYLESILLKYPQNLYRTQIELWDLPKNNGVDRRWLVQWEINHG